MINRPTPIPRLPYRVEPVYRGTLDCDLRAYVTLSDNKQGGTGCQLTRPATLQTPKPSLIAGGREAPGTGGLVDVMI